MMYFVYYVLPFFLMAVMGFCLYRFLCWLIRLSGRRETRRKRWILFGVSLLCVLPAADFTGLYTLFLMHVFVFGLCFALAFRLLSRHRRIRWLNAVCCCGIVPLLLTAVIFAYGMKQAAQVSRTTYTIVSAKALSQDYRIVLISDLHYPQTMKRDTLIKYCRQINALQPDLVVLAGDIVDENTSFAEAQEAFAALSQIEAAYGRYFVFGNHDRGRYRAQPSYSEEELRQTITGSGFVILDDKSVMIQNELLLIGREDASHPLSGTRRPLAELLPDETDAYQIVVDHQPKELAANAAMGVDLQLSGHTHDGQIFPFGWLMSLASLYECTYGRCEVDDMQAVVSSGMGGWGYAFRTQGKCEYVVIDLQSAGS